MIPVRGPTQFERQMHEFVNGVTSKSGLKKTISTRTSTQRKPSAINLNEDNAKTTTSPKTQAHSSPAKRKQSTKAMVPIEGTINDSLLKRKKSNKSGYDSSESEGTKALNEHFEERPHDFLVIGSGNYQKLPAIDQARVFLLQKSPTHSGAQIAYTNQGLMKTYLKSSLARHEMDDPIALNK